jgi:hypothetical protein
MCNRGNKKNQHPEDADLKLLEGAGFLSQKKSPIVRVVGFTGIWNPCNAIRGVVGTRIYRAHQYFIALYGKCADS